MILQRVRMENFRQFRGKQEIVFAGGGSSKRSKRITVLFGANGRGKTGIFRALMFGLYGELSLSQDEQAKGNEIFLVNRHQLESTPGEPVQASVEIEFQHSGRRYHIRRELSAIRKKAGRVIEQKEDVRLQIQGEDGNTETITNATDVQTEITRVLDHRVREYFLFDGEKIERLTRATPEQRKEVAEGIRNLLNIDALNKAIKASESLCRSLDNEVERKSTGELQQVIQQITEQEDLRVAKAEDVQNLEIELKQVAHEKRDVDEKLQQYQDIRELVEERGQLEARQGELQDILKSANDECRKAIPKVAMGLAQKALEAVKLDLDQRRQKGDIPPVLRSDLIEQLLDSGRCICGRELKKGTSPFGEIVKWMKKIPNSDNMGAALEVWRGVSSILANMASKQDEAHRCLIRFSDTETEQGRIEDRLDAIKREIGEDERGDAAELQSIRDRLEEGQITLRASTVRLELEIEDVDANMKNLTRQREKLESDEAVKNSLVRRSQVAREVRTALKNVLGVFVLEAAELIGRYATEIMHEILDEEGKRNLKEVIVKKDYSLQMVDQWDGQFLANISAGQRQIMSIAFITALARAAAGTGILEMPLFMDTPFGRLSQSHRHSLIREIPKLASQWILLATDTELRREEGQSLIDGKQLGKFYEIRALPDGTSELVEHPIEDVPVLLKASKEDR